MSYDRYGNTLYKGYKIVSHNPSHMGNYIRSVDIFKGEEWIDIAKSIIHAKKVINERLLLNSQSSGVVVSGDSSSPKTALGGEKSPEPIEDDVKASFSQEKPLTSQSSSGNQDKKRGKSIFKW